MSHRKHLFSLRLAHALRETLKETPYTKMSMGKDLMAGITVAIVAIPLSMALAIASGVAPQYGLYSAIVAGFLTPLFGGSRYSVSGPTAAFVVILAPIVQLYGLSGLLIASIMAGMIQLLMAKMRVGRYIEYIPEAVTLGFTSGIGVVIATLQLKDFMGLNISVVPEHFIDKIFALTQAMPDFMFSSFIVGATTLLVLIIWPRLNSSFPSHLPAITAGTILAFMLNKQGMNVATIDSTFNFIQSNGAIGHGIPSVLPHFQWPWQRLEAGEAELVFSWELVQHLLSAAFAIAMLGAIESLLCAVVLDGMTGRKHSANSELMGQGIGNIITPFFGGITSTAAIARSTVNINSGAVSPISAMIHALAVLIALVLFSRLLGFLPMPSMAALLIMVAWKMSEASKAIKLLKSAPSSDIFVFLTCFSLTVLFDMVIAITTGIVLASLLFMKNMAEMTRIKDISTNQRLVEDDIPKNWKVFKIDGPLFFAAADRIFGELSLMTDNQRGLVLYLDGVTMLDAGGLSALIKFLDKCYQNNTQVYLADFQFQPLKTLAKARFNPDEYDCQMFPTLTAALEGLPSDRRDFNENKRSH